MKKVFERKYDFDDVLIVPNRSTMESRKEVQLARPFQFMHSPRIINVIPIMCANMASIAGKNMADVLSRQNMMTCLHKYLSLEEIMVATNGNVNVFMTIGMKDSDLEKIKEFIAKYNYSPNICIDVPNAYLEKFVKYCATVRELCPNSVIMAGNVVTPEMTQELLIHGKVDIVKVGIGPGSQCETKNVTGVSYPQISAALECSKVAHGLKTGDKRLGLICLDGGFKHIGDLAKGFCAGADFCMTASLFSGTDECCGEWEYDENKNKTHLLHYGMSSHYAQEKHEGIQKNYRASEGKVSKIPAKGPVINTILEILGGLRSTGTYIGAYSIKDFNKCGRFISVN